MRDSRARLAAAADGPAVFAERGDTLRAEPFDGIELAVAELFDGDQR